MDLVLTTDLIKNLIEKFQKISNKTAYDLLNCAILKRFNKNDLLEKENEKTTSQYIMVEGYVRLFYTDKMGNEHTIAFYSSGQPIAPIILRSIDFISFVNIQIISKYAYVLVFSAEKMELLMQNNKELANFGYKIVMLEAFRKVEREKILLTADGIEKLIWFRKNYQSFENIVPHYYIASFLGLTTTSLSRLRKKLARE